MVGYYDIIFIGTIKSFLKKIVLISGSVKSFNYDHIGCYSNDQVCDSTNIGACDIFAGFTGHLNNLDYTVCIEQEYGFCGTEYYQVIH